MPMMAIAAGACSSCMSLMRCRMDHCSDASMAASYTSVMPASDASSSITPLIHARPMRSISCLRMARMELAKSLMLPALRSSVALVWILRLSRERGCRDSSLPSQVTDSTDLLSASPRNRELDSMWHRRCAADGESRRNPRYSLSEPKFSSSLRQLSSPMSGFCPSPSHCNTAGSRMRLIFAAREMPAVSAVTWRMAASASANPMDSNRSCVAFAESSTCSSSSPALMGSMGL